MTPLRARCLGLGLALAVWGAAAGASAQITVQLEACGALGGVEVTRALELEIEQAATTPLGVRVLCDARGLLIEVDDPITDKRLVRRVPGVDAGRAGAARTVALLVSELVLASWAELLFERENAARSPSRSRALARVERALGEVPRQGEALRTEVPRDAEARAANPVDAPETNATTSAPSGTPTPSVAPALPAAPALPVAPALPAATAPPPAPALIAAPSLPVATALPAAPRPRAARSSRESDSRDGPSGPLRVRADASAGLRLRDVQTPFVTWLGALDARVRMGGGVAVGARVSVEVADVARRAGTIAFAAVGAGLLVSAELVQRGAFALELFGEARAAWLRLDGRPSRSSVEGRARDDLLVELEVGAAPALDLGPVRLALTLSGGATILGPIGTVSGEPDLVLPGFFASAGLRLGLR